VNVVWSADALEGLDSAVFWRDAFVSGSGARFAARVMKRLEDVSRFPLLGRVVPEFDSEQIREVLEAKYRIVYRVSSDHIVVIAVVPGAASFTD
jgi:plasmid stabilization system protein ParE